MNKIKGFVVLLPFLLLSSQSALAAPASQRGEGLDNSQLILKMQRLGLISKSQKVRSIDWNKLDYEFNKSIERMKRQRDLPHFKK